MTQIWPKSRNDFRIFESSRTHNKASNQVKACHVISVSNLKIIACARIAILLYNRASAFGEVRELDQKSKLTLRN